MLAGDGRRRGPWWIPDMNRGWKKKQEDQSVADLLSSSLPDLISSSVAPSISSLSSLSSFLSFSRIFALPFAHADYMNRDISEIG